MWENIRLASFWTVCEHQREVQSVKNLYNRVTATVIGFLVFSCVQCATRPRNLPTLRRTLS